MQFLPRSIAVLTFVLGKFRRKNNRSASMEHSENKIITHSVLFGNEVGPGVLQYSVQSA